MRTPSPHEGYAESLRGARLDQTALGADWLRAASRALEQPVAVELPFREAGYFAPDRPAAVGYRVTLQRGRTFEVQASFEGVEPGRLFVDLFRIDPDGTAERVTSMAAGTTTLQLTVDRDGDYLVRVQPELLRGGRFDLAQRTLASLPFPVQGLSGRAVQSQFGAERDAGARRHEGIDIFAARGTPVVAVTAGVAQPSANNLGGTVVWLQDRARRSTYYYAHLDRTALTGTATVAEGQVLGFVGNSGNARTTAPHLHFGIYAAGAIDPQPFLAPDQVVPTPPRVDLPLGTLGRVAAASVVLRLGTAADAAPAATLPRGTPMTVLGAAGSALRVLIPDDTAGYVPRRSVVAADTALTRRTLPAGASLQERPRADAPTVHVVPTPAAAEVIGRFAGFELVRAPSASGWVATPARP